MLCARVHLVNFQLAFVVIDVVYFQRPIHYKLAAATVRWSGPISKLELTKSIVFNNETSSRQTANSYGLFAFLFLYIHCEMKAVACRWMIVYRKIKQILRKCKFLTVSVCGGCIYRFHRRSHFPFILCTSVIYIFVTIPKIFEWIETRDICRVEWCVRAQSLYTQDHFTPQWQTEDKNIATTLLGIMHANAIRLDEMRPIPGMPFPNLRIFSISFHSSFSSNFILWG